MVSLLNAGKPETMRAAKVNLLAWFFVFMIGEALAFGLAKPQSNADAATQAGCANPNGSLLLRDLSEMGVQDSKNADQHYARGIELKSSGDNVGAELEFKAALSARPKEGKYVRELAYLYIQGKRDDEAIKVIQDYSKLCGETALAYNLAGELLFQRRQFDAARGVITKSLKLDDHSPRMHELLGLGYLAKNGADALSEAVSELQKAEEGDPDNAEIRFFYGRVLYDRGRYVEARNQFLACLKIQPDYRKALENLGLCQEALGDPTEAARSYIMAMKSEEVQPGAKHGEPFGYYGAMLVRLNKPEEAIQILRRGVSASPNSFVVNFELGRALLALGQLQEAEHYLLTAERLAPAYPRTYYLLGQVHQKQRRLSQAKQEFAKFEQLNRGAENIGFPVTDREGGSQ